MKVVFLDIDGVLNCQDWYIERQSNPMFNPKNMSRDEYKRWEFSPTLVSNLNIIIEQTGAVICVSSTWRRGYDIEGLQKLFKSVGIVGEVVGMTPSMHSPKGIKDEYTIPRGCEIDYWLGTQKFKRINWSKEKQLEYLEKSYVKNYVIIDDDSDMLLSQREHFIKKTTKNGLTEELVNRCVEILNKSIIDLYYDVDNNFYDENVYREDTE